MPLAFAVWKPDGEMFHVSKVYAELWPDMVEFLQTRPTLQEFAGNALAMTGPDATQEEIADDRSWTLSGNLSDELQVLADKWFQRSIRKSATGWAVVVLNDISEQKCARQRLENRSAELEQANQRLIEAQKEAALTRRHLEEVIETTPCGIALWDSDDNLLILNRRYLELQPGLAPHVDDNSGYGEFSRNSIRTSVPDATDDEVETIFQSFNAKTDSGANRSVFQAPNGKWLQLDFRRTGEGGHVAVCSDVTELFEIRRHLVAAVGNMQDGFILWGADDRIVLVNERVREMMPDRAELLVPGTTIQEFAERSAELGKPGATDATIAKDTAQFIEFRRD